MFRASHHILLASLTAVFLMLALAPLESPLYAQSVSQNFPTPITTNEVSGVIPARELGDSRVTTYYYMFEGDTGDVFVNVSTSNFSGDVDIFAQNGLRPISKIVIYADLAENETGRVIYLRKPERLLLRVQGRSPGDDPASYRIKFAGSFVAMKDTSLPSEPELPKVTTQADTGIRVNSVGTIIEVAPKPKKTETAKVEESAEPKKADRDEIAETPEKREEPAAETPKREEPSTPAAERRTRTARSRAAKPAATESATEVPTITGRRAATRRPPRSVSAEAPAVPDPLASIRLVIAFKDGKLIERPMNEVLRFSVDKGVLTVISRDGSIGRYSILDVEKVTIQ